MNRGMKFQIWYAGSDIGAVLYMPETRELIRNYELGKGFHSYSQSGLLWDERELLAGGGYLIEEFVLKKTQNSVVYKRVIP